MQSEVDGRSTTVLAEAAGKTVAQLMMPGSQERDSAREGPQVKLRLCKWFEKNHVDLGSSDETHEVMVNAVAEAWGVPRWEIVRILKHKERWLRQCEDRGVNEQGLRRDESHLPRYLRKSVRGK